MSGRELAGNRTTFSDRGPSWSLRCRWGGKTSAQGGIGEPLEPRRLRQQEGRSARGAPRELPVVGDGGGSARFSRTPTRERRANRNDSLYLPSGGSCVADE